MPEAAVAKNGVAPSDPRIAVLPPFEPPAGTGAPQVPSALRGAKDTPLRGSPVVRLWNAFSISCRPPPGRASSTGLSMLVHPVTTSTTWGARAAAVSEGVIVADWALAVPMPGTDQAATTRAPSSATEGKAVTVFSSAPSFVHTAVGVAATAGAALASRAKEVSATRRRARPAGRAWLI